MKNKQKKWKYSWAIKILFITFAISILLSYLSANAVENIRLLPAIFILIIVVFIGIVADIIGVAVTVGSEEDFHAKASKKIDGAKSSIRLIRNSAKVSNICCDVIGDICGVLSGAISAMLAVKIATNMNLNINIEFIISATVAAVTVGSKAAGKVIAQEYSTNIVHIVGRLINKK